MPSIFARALIADKLVTRVQFIFLEKLSLQRQDFEMKHLNEASENKQNIAHLTFRNGGEPSRKPFESFRQMHYFSFICLG